MKKKIVVILSILTVLIAGSIFIYIAKIYNLGNQQTTVAQIRDSAWDDERVIVDGQFIEYIYKDVYIFKDNEGNEITVEVDDGCWYQIKMNTPVRIFGEVDKDWHGRINLDIKYIEKI